MSKPIKRYVVVQSTTREPAQRVPRLFVQRPAARRLASDLNYRSGNPGDYVVANYEAFEVQERA